MDPGEIVAQFMSNAQCCTSREGSLGEAKADEVVAGIVPCSSAGARRWKTGPLGFQCNCAAVCRMCAVAYCNLHGWEGVFCTATIAGDATCYTFCSHVCLWSFHVAGLPHRHGVEMATWIRIAQNCTHVSRWRALQFVHIVPVIVKARRHSAVQRHGEHIRAVGHR